MRFLADENFPGEAVMKLIAAGHDVVWIRREMPGATDTAVLARTVQDGRILLTFDKDFGELAWRAALPPSCGIVLFRLPMPRVDDELVQRVLARSDWPGTSPWSSRPAFAFVRSSE
jgi:predicted nuclease of predicted toxin-antitoxin system